MPVVLLLLLGQLRPLKRAVPIQKAMKTLEDALEIETFFMVFHDFSKNFLSKS